MGADEPERELEDMERRSEHLQEEISDAKADWRAKQADPAVPGANPPARKDDED